MPTCKWVFSGAQHQFGRMPLLTPSMSEMGDSGIPNQVCWVNVHHRNYIVPVAPNASNGMQKALGETQTLHASCRKVEPKFFRPAADPFPGTWDGQNLISWRWLLLLPTNPVWWGSMHTMSSYHGTRPTNKQKTTTNKQTQPQSHRQDRLQYTVPLSLACSVIKLEMAKNQKFRFTKLEPNKNIIF